MLPSRIAIWMLVGTLCAAVRAEEADDYTISPRQEKHWAWKQPVRQPPPAVKHPSWVRNHIDAFVLARLEAAGLEPAPTATREQLIRRVTLDLTGLPSTPAEIDAFVRDRSPAAW